MDRLRFKAAAGIVLILLGSGDLRADTLLVRLHSLPFPVMSVAVSSQGEVQISSGQGRQIWEGDRFKVLDPSDFEGVVSHQGRIVTHPEFIRLTARPPQETGAHWQHLFPSSAMLTAACDAYGRCWVCDGNQLFEYEINDRKAAFLAGKSVRGIMLWKNKILAQTYSGLFYDGRPICPQAPISDGNFLQRGDSVFSFGMDLAVLVPFKDQFACDEMLSRRSNILPDGVETYQSGEFWRGQIWVGNNRGLAVLRGNGELDYREQGFDVIEIEPADTGLFVLTRDRGIRFWDGLVLRDLGLNFICYTMKPWTDGRWLLATDMGLGIWQPEAEVVDFLTTEDGLSSNAICSIHVDDEGLIWFSTFAGVQCFKEGEGIIETQYRNIEFNRRSFALGSSDVMYFGSVNGIFPVIRRGQKFSDKSQDIWFITLIVALLALTSWVVWSLRRIRRMNQERQAEALSQTAELFALQIEKLTLEHLPHASVSNLADALGLSERQFFRKAAELGVKPGNIIRSAKVKRAKLLLLEGNLSFSEVAHQVGYSVPHLRKLLSARTSS